MPVKTVTKTITRKRPYRRRYKKSKSKRGFKLMRPFGGFGRTKKVLLKYVDTYTLTSLAGVSAKHIMRCNSVYDPDKTGVGHQPMWHDLIASVYRKYRVISSKIKVTFIPYPAEIQTCGILTHSGAVTPTSDLDTLLEQNQTTGAAIVKERPRIISRYWSARKQRLPRSHNEASFGSTPSSTNPEFNEYDFVIYAQNMDSTLSTNCIVKIEMNYYLDCYDMKEQAQN